MSKEWRTYRNRPEWAELKRHQQAVEATKAETLRELRSIDEELRNTAARQRRMIWGSWAAAVGWPSAELLRLNRALNDFGREIRVADYDLRLLGRADAELLTYRMRLREAVWDSQLPEWSDEEMVALIDTVDRFRPYVEWELSDIELAMEAAADVCNNNNLTRPLVAVAEGAGR